MDGICTLGNDVVLDQVIALLNSIEMHHGSNMPVCIYPYDDNIEQLTAEVARRPNVTLYDDQASIERWENFAKAVWDAHPFIREAWRSRGITSHYYRLGTYHRFCSFDGPFDRFVYMDADTLLLQPLTKVFQCLDSYDFATYDFQFKDLSHIYETDPAKIHRIFPIERTSREIFCSGFYASKRDMFSDADLAKAVELIASGEYDILYPFAPNQTVLNYLAMRLERSIGNLSFLLPPDEITGCSVTSPHFIESDNGVILDKGKPLTYLHYIGIPSSVFKRICQGENLEMSYRQSFLYYRYLDDPSKCPTFSGTPKPYNPPPSLMQRATRKLKRILHR